MACYSKQIIFHFRNIVHKSSHLYCVRPGQGLLLEGKNNVRSWEWKSMSSDDGDKKSTGDGERLKGRKSEEKGDKNNSSDKLNYLLRSILRNTDNRKEGDKSGGGVVLAVPVKQKDDKGKKKSKKGKGRTEDPQEIKLGKRVLGAVKKVAESVGGDPAQIENELVNRLESSRTPKAKLSEIFEGMTVEGEKTKDRTTSDDLIELETSRAARVHRLVKDTPVSRLGRFTDLQWGDEDGEQRRRSRRPPQSFSDQPQYYKVDLFGARPLGIFDPIDNTKQPTKGTSLLKTWDSLHQKELKMLVTNPPANGFEEMILWTEQKKLWRFPIDNEQGLTEEAKYSFEDHVFLENQIESWCPPKGPVRNFMELVCVGLSKNSYLTVPEKREYLAWYQDYFKGKSAVLKQTGAGEVK